MRTSSGTKSANALPALRKKGRLTVIKTILEFLRSVSWPIAWNAAKRLSSWLGVLSLIAWFGSLHYYLIAPSILFLASLWFLLYKLEYGWRSRRTFGERA
jgi:hypothetical protein